MTRKFFGTDGIRGRANAEPMTADIALKVGMAAGSRFIRGDHRHRVVIGKDTRLSGYMIEPALTAGFVAVGMDPILVGPLPTPAVAMLTRSLRADLGVMISASHNPYHDNGIKLFGPDGYKLSDQVEAEIEELLNSNMAHLRAASDHLGRAKRLDDAQARYIEFAKSSFPKGLSLEGMRIVVDCANGAAYKVAPTVLWELGAEVIPLGIAPDGFNINGNCGSTSPEAMIAKVKEMRADLGIALDGDADRVVLADENGRLVDGDQLLAVVAAYWRQAGHLRGPGVVATVMSNLGLERYLASQGVPLLRTQVGDRYVVERMRAEGANVGGEQSGHIVLSDFATTGDGLVAALQILAVIREGGHSASATCRRFEPLPQILKNVKRPRSALDHAGVKAAISAAEGRLGKAGRVLIRPSGTEAVIRVMAEGEDDALVVSVVDDICAAIEKAA